MAQGTSSTPRLSPTVPPTEPNSGQPSPPMLEQEHTASEAPTADAVAKRERPNVSITLHNSPAAFGPSELATPPATASSETMHIPTPAKQAYQPESPAANLPVVHSPVEKTDESTLKSPPATDSQSDSSTKSFDSDASSLAPPLKRRLSEASLDEDAAAAENAKKGRRNGKMFQCTGFGDCSMCFTRSEHLARHIRKHTGERPFECKCGRAFSRLDNLRQHIYTVHASEPQNYQTIKQCLPVHIPKKKDLKQTMSIAPPQPVAVLPSMAQVLPMGPGMAPMMMPAMGPHPPAAPHASPAAPGPAAPGVAHLPQQPPASAPQQQPMVAPAGYQAPTPAKATDQAMACPPNTSQLPGSRLQPVYFPQQAAAHAPAFVYVSDMPQMYCLPQQQLQLMPQYMTQYSYPVPLAYPPAAAPALAAKPAQPPSPPISQATSPQVHMAPLPQ